MAKKNVVIFDGEDKFINPKKAVYSKSKGQSKKGESFKSAISDDERQGRFTQNYGEQVQDGNVNANQSYTEQIQYNNETNVGSASPIEAAPQYAIPNVPEQYVIPSVPEISAPPVFNITPPSLRDIINPTINFSDIVPVPPLPTAPAYVAPPPIYVAPTPPLPTPSYEEEPTRKTMPIREVAAPLTTSTLFGNNGNPPSVDARNTPIYTAPVPPLPPYVGPRLDDVYDGRRPPRLDDAFPPLNQNPPIGGRFPINGLNPYQPNPIYTSPIPPLPPRGRIIEDPMGGGGSPVMGGPEIPRPNCPTGFVFNFTTGICTPKPMLERDPILVPRDTTSSTTTTTTKVAAAVQTTTSSTTTTTTIAILDKICNPPIYAAPKYYKWVSKGNCAYELVVDDTQLKDAAPAPILPATGQPIFNINVPTGGLGTIPTTTSTTVQTTTLKSLLKGEDSGGSGGGGGGGSPFPEEPAPIGVAPKKNYFWWYVGGALAIYLLMKRKNKQ